MKTLKILSRVYVRDLDAAIAFYEALTGETCESRFAYDVTSVPTGFNMTAKHNDGTIAEYVEFSAA